jgi:hypothetical protein
VLLLDIHICIELEYIQEQVRVESGDSCWVVRVYVHGIVSGSTVDVGRVDRLGFGSDDITLLVCRPAPGEFGVCARRGIPIVVE